MDMTKIRVVKVPKSNKYQNIMILRNRMRELGFPYLNYKCNWVEFCARLRNGRGEVAYDHVTVLTHFFSYKIDIECNRLAHNVPVINKAIMEFYEAEGISDE